MVSYMKILSIRKHTYSHINHNMKMYQHSVNLAKYFILFKDYFKQNIDNYSDLSYSPARDDNWRKFKKCLLEFKWFKSVFNIKKYERSHVLYNTTIAWRTIPMDALASWMLCTLIHGFSCFSSFLDLIIMEMACEIWLFFRSKTSNNYALS